MMTRAQLEKLPTRDLLIRLMQESSEVIKAASKWALFGPYPSFDGVDYDNVRDATEEFTQTQDIYEVLMQRIEDEARSMGKRNL